MYLCECECMCAQMKEGYRQNKSFVVSSLGTLYVLP